MMNLIEQALKPALLEKRLGMFVIIKDYSAILVGDPHLFSFDSSYEKQIKQIIKDIPDDRLFKTDMRYRGEYATALFKLLRDLLSGQKLFSNRLVKAFIRFDSGLLHRL